MTRNTSDDRVARAIRLAITATLLFALAATAAAGEAETESAAVDTVSLAALSPKDLFLRASSAALQFAPMIQPSRRALVREYDRSLPYLVTQLDTDGPRERHALENILVRIGEPAVEPLIEALDRELERTDTLRGARLAAGILGRLRDDRATQALNKAAAHSDWKVRSSVASALGRIGSPAGLDGLLRLLRDENEIVRKSAAVAIRRMATEPTPPDDEHAAETDAAPDAGAKVDADARAGEAERYQRALAARGATREDQVILALARALSDQYYHVRYSAAGALAEIGAAALPALTKVVKDGTGTARLVALSAIGRIADTSQLPLLEALLSDDDWSVRAFAAEAIGRIGANRRTRKALSVLLATETHPFVVMRAGEALAPM